MSTRPTRWSTEKGLDGALADRGDPRREGRGRQGAVQQQPPSSGTTASSGNAWRRRRASADRQARRADRRRLRLDRRLLAKLKEEAVGHFSNGWAWLVLDRDALKITSLHDADTPVVHEGMKPLLTLDVWEHAYYIDYRNERPEIRREACSATSSTGSSSRRNLDGEGVSRADQPSQERLSPQRLRASTTRFGRYPLHPEREPSS